VNCKHFEWLQRIESPPNQLTDSRIKFEFKADFCTGGYRDIQFPFDVFDRALRRVTIVVLEETTESLATLDLAGDGTDLFVWLDDLIAQLLMIAFCVVMLDEAGIRECRLH
jgi:hypothetical protein